MENTYVLVFLAGMTGIWTLVTRLTLKKLDDQLYLACGGMLECFTHFKLSQNKPRESQQSKNAFPYLPMIH